VSFNQLENAFTLRMLALCPRLSSLSLEGNPVVKRVKDWRALVTSYLPLLRDVDGAAVVGLRRSPHIPASLHSPSATASVAGSASSTLSRSPSRGRSRSPSRRAPQGFSVHVSGQRSLSPTRAKEAQDHSLQSFALRSFTTQAQRQLSPQSKAQQEQADRERHAVHDYHLRHRKELQDRKHSTQSTKASRDKVISTNGIAKMVRRLSVSMSEVRGGWGGGASDAAVSRADSDQARRGQGLTSSSRGGGRSGLSVSFDSESRSPASMSTTSTPFSSAYASSSRGLPPPRRGRSPQRAFDKQHSSRLAPSASSSSSASSSAAALRANEARQQEAMETITDWFSDSGRELEAAAAALQLCFWMSVKPEPEAAGLAIFLRSVDQLSFAERVSLPRRVEEAVGVCSDDLELMQAVGAQLERLVAFQLLLRDMRQLILSSATNTFAPRLRALMETERGVFVNTHILAPTGCDYDYSLPPPAAAPKAQPQAQPQAQAQAQAQAQPQVQRQGVVSPRSSLAAVAAAAVERHNTPEPPEDEARSGIRSRRSFSNKSQSQSQPQPQHQAVAQGRVEYLERPAAAAAAVAEEEEEEGYTGYVGRPVDTHAPPAPLSEMFVADDDAPAEPPLPPPPSVPAPAPAPAKAMSAKDRIKQRLGLA